MKELERLFADFSRERVTRWWIGDKPSCPDEKIVNAIAMQVGLPAAKDPQVLQGLCRLEFHDAAFVLARAGTTSLAYDQNPPSTSTVRRCEVAIAPLDQTPTFLTNGSWAADKADLWWDPLTTATFDCGVIAWDRQRAFVFWAEEED